MELNVVEHQPAGRGSVNETRVDLDSASHSCLVNENGGAGCGGGGGGGVCRARGGVRSPVGVHHHRRPRALAFHERTEPGPDAHAT